MQVDLAVVGAGIAGSSMAVVLAREGLDVVLLEQQRQYADRVRGEFMMPWGVAEAQRLGLDPVLLGAGGYITRDFVDYGDAADSDGVGQTIDLSAFVEGVSGGLNVGHPAACEALAGAAAAHGATVLRGVSHVEVTPGARPRVSYRLDGASHEVPCRLVIGADGRASRVRRQAGIGLERAAETHLIAGLLVEDLEVARDRNVAAVGDDAFMYTFPLAAGLARLYLCPGLENPQRFAGADGPSRFLRSFSGDGVPEWQAWRDAVPVGPCRTYRADDTWTDRPFTEGVVLVGDAGGYNNPLIGQGLSLALRDVRALAEVLLEEASWEQTAFIDYGMSRSERLRRMRFMAQLDAAINTTFGPPGRELRQRVNQRLAEDETLSAWFMAELAGPEAVPADAFTDGFRRRLLEGSASGTDAFTGGG